jgi:hypothetical protein
LPDRGHVALGTEFVRVVGGELMDQQITRAERAERASDERDASDAGDHPERRERLAERVSAASYGTVLVLAAIAAISAGDVRSGFGWELVMGVGAATWLAHVYAEVVGDHIRSSVPASRAEIGKAMVDGLPIILASMPPAFVLGLGRASAVDASRALTTSVVIAIVQLVGVGIYVGSHGARSRGRRWGFAAGTAVLGIVVGTVLLALGH